MSFKRNGDVEWIANLQPPSVRQYTSWKADITQTGVLMDVESDEIVAQSTSNAAFSKDLIRNKTYLLLYTTGEFVGSGSIISNYTVIAKIDGFY
ncbi:MAG: hypothetical protein R2728_09230 [Chitinophagales bacterium]